MRSPILGRIAAETGVPDLADRLARLSPSDLNSLLLEIFRTREISAANLIRAAKPLTAPSAVDARVMNEFDRAAFSVARAFHAVDLSPVDPLGLNRTLGGIDQNNVLSALRGVEVSGDPTSSLALEAARRRKRGEKTVQLCASHRLIRMQPFDVPGFTPHFRLFGLVTAGRDRGSLDFEISALGEHIRFYLDLLRELNRGDFQFDTPLVEISDTRVTRALLEAKGVSWEEARRSSQAHKHGGAEQFLAERGVELPAPVTNPDAGDLEIINTRLVSGLRTEYPEAEFRFDRARLEGLGYYAGICLRISPAAPDGERHAIIDGGFTDWTARLLQNRKERFLASGIGSQFAGLRYRVSSR
jgi:hypothetical protein